MPDRKPICAGAHANPANSAMRDYRNVRFTCSECGEPCAEPQPGEGAVSSRDELRAEILLFDRSRAETGIAVVTGGITRDEADVTFGRDIEKLLEAIDAYTSAQVAETEKAYGGCRNCYGKGYATTKSQIIGYGTDGDIGGYEGKFKQELPVRMIFCECDRGEQLQARVDQSASEAERSVVSAIYAKAQEFALADTTMIGSEELRGYHWFNAVSVVQEQLAGSDADEEAA